MAKTEQKKIEDLSEKQLADLGKKFVNLYETGYLSVRHMFWFNILKGIAYGFGFFIGGTVIVALVIWFLGQFEQVPFLQSLLNSIQNTVKH